MAKCMIKRTGNFVDTDKATATAGDVVEPYTIVGQGSDNTKRGTIKNISRSYDLPVNGSVFIENGFYDGNTSVRQNKQYINAPSFSPGSTDYTFPCKDKIVRGSFTLEGIKNLAPENIRNGVQIGDVIGNFSESGFIYDNGWKRTITIIEKDSNKWFNNTVYDNGTYAEMKCTLQSEGKRHLIFIDVASWIPRPCNIKVEFMLTYEEMYSWADDIDFCVGIYRGGIIPTMDNYEWAHKKELSNVRPGKSRSSTITFGVDPSVTGLLIGTSTKLTSVRINKMYLDL